MKQWVIREQASPDLVRHILFYRGIKENEEIEKFINPDYEKDLHDPFLMLGMNKSVERILQALKNNERIIIFGDYDADGVCACAIFSEFFKKICFENFHIHIPDRHLDGYGLTMETIKEFTEQKAGLVITLDCGITDYEEVEKINEAGIDVIITDHHLVPEKLPPALAIIDSKQKDDEYPFKHLCGAGVVFKIIQALIQKGGFNIAPGWEKWLLDLVALATIADMVPLTGENRVLTYYGLRVFKKTHRPGLISLFKRLDISPSNIIEEDIAFMIGPRINLASRMDHASTSYVLLTTESQTEADWIAGHLELLNVERRKIVDDILRQIAEKISKMTKPPDIIIEGDFRWNTGVLGLLANRLVEKYHCPAFLWGKGIALKIKGSCRSDGSINVVEFMKLIPKNILIELGGHAMSGGFSIADGKEEDFKKELLKVFAKAPKQKTKNNILYIDKEISLDEINWDFYSLIEKLQPFGMDNPKPVFLISGLEIAQVRKFGNAGLHLQLDFKKSDGEVVPAIGFFASDDNLNLNSGQRIDLVASLEKSFFHLPAELRLRLVDIRIK